MERRITVLFIIVAAALASGCSNSGVATLPADGGKGGTASIDVSKQVRIREFADLPVYSNNYYPSAIAQASGSLWVTDDIDQDAGACVVVRIAPSGKQQHAYYVNGEFSGADLRDITLGPDGALWIADSYNWQLIRMTTQGKWTYFPLGNEVGPERITLGPDKALWFTFESPIVGAGIGRFTTGGHFRSYPASVPLDIAAGSDGALWFTQPGVDEVGRITTRGKVTEYSNGITAGSQPYGIASGPDGALWFTEQGGRIGRITTAGNVTEYSNGITAGEEPFGIAAGPDDAMWFTEFEPTTSYGARASKIGRISLSGTIDEYSKNLNPASGPTAIAGGPDRKMWFVETNTDETGRVNP